MNLKRLFVLGVLLAVCGCVFMYAQARQRPNFVIDEHWMELRAPAQVDAFRFVPSTTNPYQSYKMDDRTYDLLKPFGIVCRVYQAGNKQVDVVLISSNKRESFHSPTVCLPAQGWEMNEIHDETLKTKTRGTIPISVATIIPPGGSSMDTEYLVFFYRNQNHFIARSKASIFALTLAMFEGPIHGNFDMNTVFYRFTSQKHMTKDELLKFVADFLDTAYGPSGHYF